MRDKDNLKRMAEGFDPFHLTKSDEPWSQESTWRAISFKDSHTF